MCFSVKYVQVFVIRENKLTGNRVLQRTLHSRYTDQYGLYGISRVYFTKIKHHNYVFTYVRLIK